MSKSDDIYYTREMSVPVTPRPDRDPGTWRKTRIIGGRRTRVDAYERVSGTAVYPSDVLLPGMLYGAILRCPHPHAVVKRVDTAPAEKMPGVRAVIYGSTPEADLMWPHSGKVMTRLFDPHCRFEGETVAAVAAETPYQARDAVRAIQVTYDIKDHIVDEQKALEKSAASVHAGGNQSGSDSYGRGDMEKGFKEADVVLEESYSTACELHTPVEPHGCVADWHGDALTIWESTQGVYAVQSRVAKVLGLPLSKVRVIGHYMGGGFGSKLRTSKYSIIAALLAQKSARPVKLFLSREETFLAMGNRPPAHMTVKAGATKAGILTALDFSCLGTGGAYPAGGTSLVDWLFRDLYTCPNVRTRCTDVYIHAGPARPFRAPGHPQGSWALEQMMDALAEKIGMDPVEFRLKNIPSFSQGRDQPYTSTGLKQCIQKGAEAFGWQKARKAAAMHNQKGGHIRKGVGMGSCVWFVGGGNPPSTVVLKLFADGSVNLNMGASDIGTGTKTIMAMTVAEELGVKPEVIQIENADTGTTQYATPSGGSKTVPTEAPAVRNAAIAVKEELLQMAARELKVNASDLRFDADDIVSLKDKNRKIRITDLSELKKRGEVMGVGYRGPNPPDRAVCPFAAQFCEVAVNTHTGEVNILRFLGTNESGRVMDRLTYDGQVFGGITMGIGLGMTEFRVLDHGQTGKLLNKNWHDYKLPTALDVPMEMTSVPIEMVDGEANNTGAKGLGEPVTIPTAGAIANAVYNAVGIRMTASPINPVTLNRKLAENTQKKG